MSWLVLVGALGRGRRARDAQPRPVQASACATSRAGRAERADRRRADARHGDHRGRADDRRHDEPHDPLGGGDRAGPDRRARLREAPRSARAGVGRAAVDRRAVLPRESSLRHPSRRAQLALVDGVAPAIVERVAVQAPRRARPSRGSRSSRATRRAWTASARSADGRRPIALAELRQGEVYLNEDAADELDAREGDIVLRLRRRPAARVGVRRSSTTTAPAPTARRADAARHRAGCCSTGGPDQARARSRTAAAHGRRRRSRRGRRALQPVLAPLGLEAAPAKQDALEEADQAGNAFMSLFTTFGSFSIAAGILLIFLIFVMLAAERRGELGIARAGRHAPRPPRADVRLRGRGLRPARRRRRRGRSASGSPSGWCSVMAGARRRVRRRDRRPSRLRSLVVAYALGVLLTLVVVACLGLAREPAQHRRRRSATCPSRSPTSGAARGSPIARGSLSASCWLVGHLGGEATPFMLGVSLVLIGLVPVARALGVPRAPRVHARRPRPRRLVAAAVRTCWTAIFGHAEDGLLDLDRRRPDGRRRRDLGDHVQRRRPARGDARHLRPDPGAGAGAEDGDGVPAPRAASAPA